LKKWTDSFLEQCLDGLPKDKYRKRAQAELTDHLLELCADLESGGYSPEEAQARAVELMGEPAELNPSFREEWVRRASNWEYYLSKVLVSAIYAYATNTLFRWFIILPLLSFNDEYLANCIESGGPVLFLLFAIFNVFSGIWLIAHTLHEDFVIHPKCKKVVLYWLIFYWLLEVGPYISNLVLIPTFLIFPLFYIGHFPIIFLAWTSRFNQLAYSIGVGLVCVFFALFYSPRKKSK